VHRYLAFGFVALVIVLVVCVNGLTTF